MSLWQMADCPISIEKLDGGNVLLCFIFNWKKQGNKFSFSSMTQTFTQHLSKKGIRSALHMIGDKNENVFGD